MTRKRKMAVVFGSVGAFALIVAIVAVCCVSHFVGFSECVGSKKYDYTTQEIHVEHDGINLYGKALVPKGEPQAKLSYGNLCTWRRIRL